MKTHLIGLESYSYIFDLIDQDHSGTVNATKLKHTLNSLNVEMEIETLEAMIRVVSENSEMNFAEFERFMHILERFDQKEVNNTTLLMNFVGIDGK